MKEIALALGGGGVRGLAHIGVIRRLQQEGYTIRAIAGTSAGGLMGAIFAAGNDPSQVETYLKTLNQTTLFSRHSDDGPSLMGLHGVNQALIDLIGTSTFEQLKIPFACTAVDIQTGQEIILSNGRVVDCVLATIAFPGVLPPRQLGQTLLVDGGVLDPVPVSLARWLAPHIPIVAVCLSSPPENWVDLPPFVFPRNTPIPTPILDQFSKLRIGQALQIFSRSMDITSRMLSELRLKIDQPDVIIRPDVEKYGYFDNVNPSELIVLGDLATLSALPGLEKKMGWGNSISRRFRRGKLPGKLFLQNSPSAEPEK
jgi:NTE family protein